MKTLALATALVLALAACSAPVSDQEAAFEPQAQELLDAYGVEATDVITLIEDLDAVSPAERAQGLMASVRPTELLLSGPDSAQPVSVPIPGDNFYLSFAPFYDSTHDCYFHSLTTCMGEMGGEQIGVVITNTATGEVLIDDTMTAFDNGFVGVWLPRDIEATLVIEHDGSTAETVISTGEEDATCVTTVQFA